MKKCLIGKHVAMAIILNEPHHEKTCFSEYLTKSDTNAAIQPQKLSEDLKLDITITSLRNKVRI